MPRAYIAMFDNHVTRLRGRSIAVESAEIGRERDEERKKKKKWNERSIEETDRRGRVSINSTLRRLAGPLAFLVLALSLLNAT